MPPWLIPAALSALGFFGGSRKPNPAQSTQTSTSTNTNTNTGTSTTTPTLNPAFEPIQNMLLPAVTRRLSSPTALPAGYETEGIARINRTHDLVKMGLENDLTSRGLATSPVAGSVMENFSRGRAGDITSFQNMLPEIERDRQNEDFNLAMQVLGMGRGSTSTSTGTNTNTGTTTGTGTQQPSGGGLGGGLEGFADILGFLLGSGAFGGGSGSPTSNTMPVRPPLNAWPGPPYR